jgi:hypothetical protein
LVFHGSILSRILLSVNPGAVQQLIGKFGEANLNGKWRIPKVPLAMGANTITIEAKSVNGKLFSKQVTIYRR